MENGVANSWQGGMIRKHLLSESTDRTTCVKTERTDVRIASMEVLKRSRGRTMVEWRKEEIYCLRYIIEIIDSFAQSTKGFAMQLLSPMWLLDLNQAIHVSARRDVLQFMNLSCFAEGDVPWSIGGIICLSIVLDHPNVCCLDSDNKVRKCMMVQREMLSWFKRYFPHPHEVVLEENPTADRTVLLIWFRQLCPLMLLTHKSRLIYALLEQTPCCSIQPIRQILLHLLREALLLEGKAID